MTSLQDQYQQSTVAAIQMDMKMFKSDDIVNWLLEYQVFETSNSASKESKLARLVQDHCQGTSAQNLEELYRVLQNSVLRELSNPTADKIHHLLSSNKIEPLQRKVLLLTLAESGYEPAPLLHTPSRDYRQRSNSGVSHPTQYSQDQSSPESIMSGTSTVPYSDNQKMSPPSSTLSHPEITENDTTPIMKPLPSPATTTFNPNATPFQFTPTITNATAPPGVGPPQTFNNSYTFGFIPPYGFPPPMAFPTSQTNGEEASMPMWYFPTIPPPLHMSFAATNMPPSGFVPHQDHGNFQQSYPYQRHPHRKFPSSIPIDSKSNKAKNEESKLNPSNPTEKIHTDKSPSQQSQSKSQSVPRHHRQQSPSHYSSPTHYQNYQPKASHPYSPFHQIALPSPDTKINTEVTTIDNPWINFLLEQMPEIDRQLQSVETPSLNARNQLIHCLLQEVGNQKKEIAKLSALIRDSIPDPSQTSGNTMDRKAEIHNGADVSHNNKLLDNQEEKHGRFFPSKTTAERNASTHLQPQRFQPYNFSPTQALSSGSNLIPLAESLSSPLQPPVTSSATNNNNRIGQYKQYRPPTPHHPLNTDFQNCEQQSMQTDIPVHKNTSHFNKRNYHTTSHANR